MNNFEESEECVRALERTNHELQTRIKEFENREGEFEKHIMHMEENRIEQERKLSALKQMVISAFHFPNLGQTKIIPSLRLNLQQKRLHT